MDFPMRLNKYLAHKGFTTRRDADVLIANKKVLVNGKIGVIGQKVEVYDKVEVKNYKTPDFIYILYYKPRGIITHSPAKNETDVAMHMKQKHDIVNVFPIGRLDKDSEGLMLLTNDGRVTDRLLNPERSHEREYDVRVDKRVTQSFLNQLAKGVRIEKYLTRPARTKANKSDNKSFTIILTEGKKHQVRRMCAALGYQVIGLKRTRILNMQLRRLHSGDIHTLTPKEALELRTQIGL